MAVPGYIPRNPFTLSDYQQQQAKAKAVDFLNNKLAALTQSGLTTQSGIVGTSPIQINPYTAGTGIAIKYDDYLGWQKAANTLYGVQTSEEEKRHNKLIEKVDKVFSKLYKQVSKDLALV